MTRSGIEYELYKSPYYVTCLYEQGRIVFYFSSASNKARFEDKLYDTRKFTKQSLENRFKISLNLSCELSDLNLYRKIESRGFYLKINGEVVTWPQNLVYDGQKISVKPSEEKS